MAISSSSLIDHDPWLAPYRGAIELIEQKVEEKTQRLLGTTPLEEYSLGYLYFGLHKTATNWVLREWAPAATKLFLVTDATEWQDHESYRGTKKDDGVWEITLPLDALSHLDAYKVHVYWEGGDGYRIPAYATYVTQDVETNDFSARVWSPTQQFAWQASTPAAPETPLIYEAHIGMAGDRDAVSTYQQFTEDVLPRIDALGYNTIQLMAIQEHPYYGSFGYHVANFYAASSRFGTPDDLKRLIDTAHRMGIRVLLDIVHSHSVSNEQEGLGLFAGTQSHYFHAGARGHHDAWDSLVFDYGKPEVAHFLASNIRFWLEEYNFDGFRFDGVTSMLYHHHGLGHDFSSYDDYYGGALDLDALTYLRLANTVAHTLPEKTVTTIAEDTSALPGLAAPKDEGGVGFDYRLSMGVPDLWIKLLKEQSDESWDLGRLFHELTAHRPEERVISYAESHDQALVGDKTLIFRLLDAEMYNNMTREASTPTIDRGIALHKILRILTASTTNGGYLTFIGNEFGHPEWIDFPREGNGWSYHYAKRQWHLVDNEALRYKELALFDRAFIEHIPEVSRHPFSYVHIDQDKHILAYTRGAYTFVYNLHPSESFVDYAVPAHPGNYVVAFTSDDSSFGGFSRIDPGATSQVVDETAGALSLYLPARTALVLKWHP